MAVPSDRKRRPFLLSLSLFLLVSALLVLFFLFLDSSSQSLPFLPDRLSTPTPSLLGPLPPHQQQRAAPIPSSSDSQPNPPASAVAEAAEKADASRPEPTDAVTGGASKSEASPRPVDSSDAAAADADAKADRGVDAAGGDGGGDDLAVADVRWETCKVMRGVSPADYIPCLDNIRAIKALRSRRHMEHRERHCPVAPRPRCLVRTPAGYRLPVPWPRSRDMVRTLRACLRR